MFIFLVYEICIAAQTWLKCSSYFDGKLVWSYFTVINYIYNDNRENFPCNLIVK